MFQAALQMPLNEDAAQLGSGLQILNNRGKFHKPITILFFIAVMPYNFVSKQAVFHYLTFTNVVNH